MSISAATNHLAEELRQYYEKKDASDPIVPFLRQISLIQTYVQENELAAWESDVLASADIDRIENRSDYPLIELVWEVGRFNLFGQIKPSETQMIYEEAKELMNQTLGLQPEESRSFNFSKW